MMKSRLLAGTLLVTLCITTAAVCGPLGDMMRREVTVVEYHAGPNWAAFNEHAQGHLEHLHRQMTAGKLLYAGPWRDDNGGLSIYRGADAGAVDALLQQDPLVTTKVVTYSLRVWHMHSLELPAKG
jgi:uncharacterized protein YciI